MAITKIEEILITKREMNGEDKRGKERKILKKEEVNKIKEGKN